MRIRLKPIDRQVVVITGASSGIGLATAKLAARHGAAVVMAARADAALAEAAEEIRESGGRALAVPTDVSQEDQVRALADAAIETFGAFDTWVNNAGVSIFGTLEQVPIEEQRRLFEVNYWGLVYGSRVAVAHLKGRGGALINMGSVASDRALPLQGHYSATKHAVKGFTDALRTELMAENAPVAVTLIKPTSIDTPLPDHARNHMDVEPKLPPPVYAPEIVARAILHAATTPVRDITVGGGGRMIQLSNLAPSLSDMAMSRIGVSSQRSSRPARPHRSWLDGPASEGRSRGDVAWVREHSLSTWAALHPLAVLGATAAIGAAAVAIARRRA